MHLPLCVVFINAVVCHPSVSLLNSVCVCFMIVCYDFLVEFLSLHIKFIERCGLCLSESWCELQLSSASKMMLKFSVTNAIKIVIHYSK